MNAMAVPQKAKSSPKDVFLNLLAIIALYASATSYLALLWQYINILVHDPLESQWNIFSYYDSARWAIAMVAVAFPTYITTTWFLNRQFMKHPEGRRLRTRKWLVYFTLFFTVLVMLSDLISLIYHFLQGDLTTRFVLKICAIFFVSGTTFFYYLWDIRTHHRDD